MAQITVEPMAPVSICGSPSLPVMFSTPDVFDPSNVFTVELSDLTGSFASPVVIGSVPDVGAGSVPCTFPVGIYPGNSWSIRVVASNPPQVGDGYLLPIQTVPPPSAGTNGTIAVCSNEPSFNMWTLLDGSPDAGGVWTSPDANPQPNVFVPGLSIPGCYTYIVAGTLPCADVSSTLCVTVSDMPILGSDLSITLCTPNSLVMGSGLTPGGTWTYMGGPHSNVFVPGVDPVGPYVYTIPGTAPCPDVNLTAMMNVDAPPSAGANATTTRCLSQGDVDLFAQLGGAPEEGGIWTDDDSTGQLTGSTFAVAGMPSGSYSFTYTVPGGNCPDAQSTVTVALNALCIVTPQNLYPVE
jgi:hypothetical protein